MGNSVCKTEDLAARSEQNDRDGDALLAEECLSRWFKEEPVDKRGARFHAEFADWIESLPEQMRIEARKHFESFHYVSHGSANQGLAYLYSQLEERCLCCYDDTVFTYIQRKDGSSNSSWSLLPEFKQINGIPKESIVTDTHQLDELERYPNLRTLVFVDDFCGTGGTFVGNVMKRYGASLVGRKIVYVVLYCLRTGEETIGRNAADMGLDVEVVAWRYMRSFYDAGDLRADLVKEASSALGVPVGYELGYRDSQALLAFHDSTPNNTFGYVWAKSDETGYEGIFPRESRRRPHWRDLSCDEKKRDQENYSRKKG